MSVHHVLNVFPYRTRRFLRSACPPQWIWYDPWPRQLCFVFRFHFFFLFPLPFNLHSSSNDMLDVFRVMHTCEIVWWRSCCVQIDNKSKCRGETLHKYRTKPSKTKKESKESRSDFNDDQSRSRLNVSRRVTRDVASISRLSAILKIVRGLGEGLLTYMTL